MTPQKSDFPAWCERALRKNPLSSGLFPQLFSHTGGGRF